MTTTHESGARPRLVTRLAAALRGEISATTIEALRRAGRGVYGDLMLADSLREQQAMQGIDVWSMAPGARSQFLCTWNAYALQTLGEAFIDADYAADLQTVGYLPPVTAEQAARFLGEVEYWSAAARRAAADPGFDVTTARILPAPLPPWADVEPCPVPHLQAMLASAQAMHERAEHALADFTRAGVPADRTQDAATLAGLAADADSALDYAAGLYSPGASEQVHQRTENSLRRAIEGYYRLVQLLAMPELLRRPEVEAVTVVPTGPGRLPGQPGFDPWVLTDPASRANWQQDRAAVRAIENLWYHDPDPAATLAIQAQIDAAVRAGHVEVGVTPDGETIGNYFCCPWSAVYLVRRPVIIDRRRLRPGQQFTFDVSAEEIFEGGSFKRQLLVGPFSPTREIDYCNPAG